MQQKRTCKWHKGEGGSYFFEYDLAAENKKTNVVQASNLLSSQASNTPNSDRRPAPQKMNILIEYGIRGIKGHLTYISED